MTILHFLFPGSCKISARQPKLWSIYRQISYINVYTLKMLSMFTLNTGLFTSKTKKCPSFNCSAKGTSTYTVPSERNDRVEGPVCRRMFSVTEVVPGTTCWAAENLTEEGREWGREWKHCYLFWSEQKDRWLYKATGMWCRWSCRLPLLLQSSPPQYQYKSFLSILRPAEEISRK